MSRFSDQIRDNIRALATRITLESAVSAEVFAALDDAQDAPTLDAAMTHLLRAVVASEDEVSECKDVELRANAARRQAEARTAQMRDMLANALEETGAPAVVSGFHIAEMIAGKPAVGTVDLDALPEQLIRTKREPDKAALLKALRVGPVPGASLSNAKPSLTIRRKEAVSA